MYNVFNIENNNFFLPLFIILLYTFTFLFIKNVAYNKVIPSFINNLKKEKKSKIVFYIFEIFISSALIIFMFTQKEIWGIIMIPNYILTFNEKDQLLVLQRLYGLVGLIGFIIGVLYIYELLLIKGIQRILIIHHVVSICFALWLSISSEFIVISQYFSVPLQIGIGFLLYAVTEQSAFIFMLCYRFFEEKLSIKWYQLMAFTYLVTRAILLTICVLNVVYVCIFLKGIDYRLDRRGFGFCICTLIMFIVVLFVCTYTQFQSFKIYLCIINKVKQAKKNGGGTVEATIEINITNTDERGESSVSDTGFVRVSIFNADNIDENGVMTWQQNISEANPK